jgi:hypothetical protein
MIAKAQRTNRLGSVLLRTKANKQRHSKKYCQGQGTAGQTRIPNNGGSFTMKGRTDMSSHNTDTNMADLAQRLDELRDALMRLSLALKDYLAELPSPMRDEAQKEAEAHLAKLRIGGGRTSSL